MKALITAGGRGTRLRPITYTYNKHLIPIANKPIILYAIDAVKEAGITEVGITYNEKLEELQNFLGNGENFDINITYIHQKAPIGLADCVKVAEDFIAGDKFVFYLGDNMLAGGIKKAANQFENEKNCNCYLLLSEVPDPQRFGVPEFDKKGNLIKVIEKPEKPASNFAVTGIYFYDSNIFKAFKGKDAIKPSLRGEYEISDVHQWLLNKQYNIKTLPVTGWWKDTGKLNDLLLANRLILEKHHHYSIEAEKENSTLEGDIAIGKGSVIKNSYLRGPIVIGKNTLIEDSYIGPFTSIGNNCKIINSEVENSIIIERVEITDLPQRLDASLIGKDAKITKINKKPHTINLMVGDNGYIKL